ncbi:hypothetical protein H310_13347 [Aphanomyces invadans]|uniref:Uncharacterized protein n=1 Tax=Aphanomyces invadans TaxID=157072 RepID=A0A024TFC2_9STRA|nr:hypothetical protein H310_13347 [Aphanomyces invadans]ETV92286.1 hypothetical protein H310_13347 [Aphanomyces invadans]|eukprot:XP_008879037.1 hypothetical protein H310_13347 [Aphanomyces invadans]
MSREARKTAQIWASIEKMQKKEDELSLSDNSSDKTQKQQRKKKKHKRSPSDDDDNALTGPVPTGACDAGNQDDTCHTQTKSLALHKSSDFIRSSPFVPPRKKWVNQWTTHLGPKVRNQDEEVCSSKPDIVPSVSTASSSSHHHTSGVPTSPRPRAHNDETPGSASHGVSALVSPHHAGQSIQAPRLDHLVASATVPTVLPTSPRVHAGVTVATLAVAQAVPPLKEDEAEEGEYTASPPRPSPTDTGTTIAALALKAPVPDSTRLHQPPVPPLTPSPIRQQEGSVISAHTPDNGSSKEHAPSTTTPAPPASPVMNALGSRRKRKSLWDVGDPRVDDGRMPSSDTIRRPSDGRGGRSASADGRRRSWSRPHQHHHGSHGSNFSSSSHHHPNHNSTAYPPRRHTPPPQQAPSAPSLAKPRDPPRSMSSSWLPSR